MINRKSFILIIILIIPIKVSASEWIQWHNTNIQYLRGNSFELGNSNRTTVTLEHAHSWRYGDNFIFSDISPGNNDYTELHPRLSLGKVLNKELSFGPIKDVLIASTFEFAHNHTRYLYGIGIDWKIPGFKYFKTNYYVRNNELLEGTTLQSTIIWGLPFKIGKHHFLFSGFADITGAEGSRSAYQHFQPAILWDIGAYIAYPKKFYIGMEYIYWHNKFGVKGVTESNPQFELRWVF